MYSKFKWKLLLSKIKHGIHAENKSKYCAKYKLVFMLSDHKAILKPVSNTDKLKLFA